MGLSGSKKKTYSMNGLKQSKKTKKETDGGVDPAVHGAQVEDRFYNNKSFQKPDIDTTNQEQQDAALRIQTKYRQHHAKKVVQEKREDKAAVKIQAGFRGHLDRERVKSFKTSSEGSQHSAESPTKETAEEEPIDIDLNDPEVASAATKIQAGFRGHKVRKEFQDKQSDKPDTVTADESQAEVTAAEVTAAEVTSAEVTAEQPDLDIDPNDPEVVNAATKIQAGFKGYKTRRELKTHSAATPETKSEASEKPAEVPAAEEPAKAPEAAEETKPEETPAESSENKEELPDLTDPEVNQAATKIQASFKGYQTRKEFQAKKQVDGAAAEEGTAEETPAEGEAPAAGTAEAPPAEEPPAEPEQTEQ